MKENKLSITIRKSVNEVFEFATNPANTPRWIKTIEIEETNEWPIKVGTIYRNKSMVGAWSEYVVSTFESNKIFEFTSKDGNYHVRYTYIQSKNGITEMDYFEWVDRGELEQPFTQTFLRKLKSVIEESKEFAAKVKSE